MNPGPDTEGKHLNLPLFTKKSLIRKYGVKQIAMKNLKSFIALISSKKGLGHPRIRFFADLFGLDAKGKDGIYDEDKVRTTDRSE